MRLSHSKLNTILTCPMTYKLFYKMGFKLKETKAALRIGSAVHYGIEYETDDLTKFYEEEGSFSQATQYTQEQELAESMVYGYLKNKDEIFANILIDEDTGEVLELYDEYKELDLIVPLKSLIPNNEDHEFRGIIDLLLLTNKGFIIIDYKTSSRQPDWDNYLEQLYRYVYMVETMFPETPVYKLAIINLRKSMIRRRKVESKEQFRKRLRLEYEINDQDYINYHVYPKDTLDKTQMADYILNLRKCADFAEYIDTTGSYYLNYSNLITVYGKSDLYDIFKRTPDAYVLYDIRDNIKTDNDDEFRDARQIDIDAVFEENVLHKFEQFKTQAIAQYAINNKIDTDALFEHLRKNFKVDEELLELYWLNLKNLSIEESKEALNTKEKTTEINDKQTSQKIINELILR